MASKEARVVVPGETVLQVPETGQLRLGPGLLVQDNCVVATKAGIVRQSKGHVWVEGRTKRYIPQEGDLVVGTIVDRHGEMFTVDIGAPFLALLSQLSFEGATKRNRPNVKQGDVVYARVTMASRDAEPQLSCIDAMGRAAGFGALKEGVTLKITTSLARQLLASPPAPVLEALGDTLQFELAVGMNGKVWVSGSSIQTTVLVVNAISSCEFMNKAQSQVLVKRLVQSTSS